MMTPYAKFLLVPGLLVLASCAVNNDTTIIDSGPGGEDGSGDTGVVQAPESVVRNDSFVRQRILADMLYEARLAFDDNRLMSPPGNNAYDGFRAVLDFDPENAIALQGISDIVQRYVALADAAIQLRQYDNAGDLLSRAAGIERNNPAVIEARERLEEARQIEMDVFALDSEALGERNLQIMVELGEIGQYIRDREAVFLINARTDEEGRWIYKIMREAVGGYRLRGNIAVDSEPSIQVVVPQS